MKSARDRGASKPPNLFVKLVAVALASCGSPEQAVQLAPDIVAPTKTTKVPAVPSGLPSARPSDQSIAIEHLHCDGTDVECGDPVVRGEAEARSDIARQKYDYFWIGELPPSEVAQRFERRYRVKLQYTGCIADSWDARKSAAYNRMMREHLGLLKDPLEDSFPLEDSTDQPARPNSGLQTDGRRPQ